MGRESTSRAWTPESLSLATYKMGTRSTIYSVFWECPPTKPQPASGHSGSPLTHGYTFQSLCLCPNNPLLGVQVTTVFSSNVLPLGFLHSVPHCDLLLMTCIFRFILNVHFRRFQPGIVYSGESSMSITYISMFLALEVWRV